jgi:hypothetical protein
MAKKLTYEELLAKIDFFEYSIGESRKVVRNALLKHKIWEQEFHENEIAAITAVFLATKEELDNKGLALTEAIKFIAMFENNADYSKECLFTLEKINQLIAGESIQDSIQKLNGK